MIVKEKDPSKESDNYLVKMGDKAERQMAFYLRRYFGNRDDVFVFNDIKFSVDGENCQIDHLVVCDYGIYIIESKSCFGEIEYDKQDQWIRHNSKGARGMESPIFQAELQKKIFVKYINEENKKHKILGSLLGLASQGFGARRFMILIAISDETIIRHPKKQDKRVLKADKICEKIEKESGNTFRNIISALKPYSTSEGDISYTKNQVKNIAYFLEHGCMPNAEQGNNEREEPVIEDENLRDAGGAVPPPERLSMPEDIPVESDAVNSSKNKDECDHDDQVMYGKFGYYYKCGKCDRNQNIKIICESCNKKMKISKKKKEFFAICEKCDIKNKFFENK